MVLILAQLASANKNLTIAMTSQGCCVWWLSCTTLRGVKPTATRTGLTACLKPTQLACQAMDEQTFVLTIGTGQETLLRLERRGNCADSQNRVKGGAESKKEQISC